MKTLNVGIIGCGNMGRRHARAYGYHQPRTRLVAVYDINAKVAADLAHRFGCAAVDSLPALLNRSDLDAVSVCTIEPEHLEPVLRAAEAGKHILLEKPMAMTLDDAELMREAVAANGVHLMVAHIHRFDLRCRAVKEAIDAGQVGDVVSVDCRMHGAPRTQDRIKDVELSIILFRGCHGIDLMRWFTGSEAVRVYAEDLQGNLRAQGYHSEDAVFCLIRFANGAVGSIEVNSHAPVGHPSAGKTELTIVGTKGMIELDLASPWFKIADADGMSLGAGNRKDLWFREEIAAFARLVLDGGPNDASVADGIAALRISLAATESARTCQPVPLPENG